MPNNMRTRGEDINTDFGELKQAGFELPLSRMQKTSIEKEATIFDKYDVRVTIESKAGHTNQSYTEVLSALKDAGLLYREDRRFTIKPDRDCIDILIEKEDMPIIAELNKTLADSGFKFYVSENLPEYIQPRTIVTDEFTLDRAKEVKKAESAKKIVGGKQDVYDNAYNSFVSVCISNIDYDINEAAGDIADEMGIKESKVLPIVKKVAEDLKAKLTNPSTNVNKSTDDVYDKAYDYFVSQCVSNIDSAINEVAGDIADEVGSVESKILPSVTKAAEDLKKELTGFSASASKKTVADGMFEATSKDGNFRVYEVFNGYMLEYIPTGKSTNIGDGVDMFGSEESGEALAAGTPEFNAALAEWVNDPVLMEAYGDLIASDMNEGDAVEGSKKDDISEGTDATKDALQKSKKTGKKFTEEEMMKSITDVSNAVKKEKEKKTAGVGSEGQEAAQAVVDSIGGKGWQLYNENGIAIVKKIKGRGFPDYDKVIEATVAKSGKTKEQIVAYVTPEFFDNLLWDDVRVAMEMLEEDLGTDLFSYGRSGGYWGVPFDWSMVDIENEGEDNEQATPNPEWLEKLNNLDAAIEATIADFEGTERWVEEIIANEYWEESEAEAEIRTGKPDEEEGSVIGSKNTVSDIKDKKAAYDQANDGLDLMGTLGDLTK